jgi:hypothetical protein
VIHLIALLLDLASLAGGAVLAADLLADVPRVGRAAARAAAVAARFARAIGVVALATGGFYLLVHLTSGPHVFVFELVGVGVGTALLRDRLFPARSGATSGGSGAVGLLLAVFGLVAMVVGLQGLVTPD